MVILFNAVGLRQEMPSASGPYPSESFLFGLGLSQCYHLIITEGQLGFCAETVHLNIHFRFDHASFHSRGRRGRRKARHFKYLCWCSPTPPSCLGLEGFQGQVNICLVFSAEPVLGPLFPGWQEGNSCCLSYPFRELSTLFGTMGIYPECCAGRHMTFRGGP